MADTIAIVGSGPAGCYVAQALVKAVPVAEVTVIDRLPTPYGLIRYGVAPDHQGTKAVTRQFARLFERQGVAFVGNVEVGREVSVDDLTERFDAVVVAAGLHGDRPLDVPGADQPGVIGSGALTRMWNGHPEAEHLDLGRSVAVLGNGNVAMDIARILAKRAGDFAGTDLDPAHVCNGVETIHVIGRSPLAHARFDAVMVKELAGIEGLQVRLAHGDSFGGETSVTEALEEVLAARSAPADKTLIFHSGWDVAQIEGDGRVAGLTLASGDKTRTLDCDTVVTAIGYEWTGTLDRAAILAGEGTGPIFTAGWFKKGPRGTIPENRTDAQEVAARVAAWLKTQDAGKPGRAALLPLVPDHTTYDDWLAIDAAEVAQAGPARCRQKLKTRAAMMDAIQARKELV